MERLASLSPLILLTSGLIGAAGVALAAAASHGGDNPFLGTASMMCLAHAPVLLGLYLAHGHFRTAALAALVLGLGTIIFTGDLVMRHFTGGRLFPMAAPIGGMGMMLGWVLVAAGAFLRASKE